MVFPMKVLVTGATGYLGSHTTVELLHEGYEVIMVDNLSNSERSVLEGIEAIAGHRPVFFQADCTDPIAMSDIFAQHSDIVGVIHFAASKSVSESVEKPLLYYRNNLLSLIVLLEEMAKHNTSAFIFSSSCTVYGNPEKLPVVEDTPIKLSFSPYGNTKQICEEIIRDQVHARRLSRAVLLRYFNPIGAHPSALIGELPRGVPQNLLPYLMQTAAGIQKELTVFGDDYNTPDGSCIRDYINVIDLARAHISALEYVLYRMPKEEHIDVFNIGTGRGISVLELIQEFEKATGVSVPYRVAGRRGGDVGQIWADATKARNILGWEAKVSIHDTLIAAWNWQKRINNKSV